VTERKAAEAALRAEQELLQRIYDTVPVMFTIYDPELKTITPNRYFEEVTGWSAEETAATNVMRLVYPDPDYREEVAAYMRSLAPGFKDIRMTAKDGHVIHSSWANVQISDGRRVGIGIDVTDRVRAEQTLRASEERLRVALSEKETLLRELYHRTKNNMQVIKAMLEIQSRFLNDERLAKVFVDTQHRIQSMALVHEKLYQSDDLSTVDLGTYLQDLSELLIESHGVSGETIALKADIDDVQVLIDVAIPCGLVVNEIVTNALTHAFPDGRPGEIRLGVAHDGNDEIVVTVADDGDGVPEGFDFRNAGSMGMLVVHTVTEDQLMGKVAFEVDPEVRPGVTFRMRFPGSAYQRRV
jgi:PAS domain S-box-containing protein